LSKIIVNQGVFLFINEVDYNLAHKRDRNLQHRLDGQGCVYWDDKIQSIEELLKSNLWRYLFVFFKKIRLHKYSHKLVEITL